MSVCVYVSVSNSKLGCGKVKSLSSCEFIHLAAKERSPALAPGHLIWIVDVTVELYKMWSFIGMTYLKTFEIISKLVQTVTFVHTTTMSIMFLLDWIIIQYT